MEKIATSQLINGGSIALGLGALSLAFGHTEIFLLLASVGLTAYGVVLGRYLRKKSSRTDKDAPGQ